MTSRAEKVANGSAASARVICASIPAMQHNLLNRIFRF
jgi:hypothetical protein